jgi:hypothetical protein
MHKDFEALMYVAENFFHHRYLDGSQLQAFRQHANSLQDRLSTYEVLRSQELDIFQPIADQLEADYPQALDQAERALKHWIAVLRSASMAMLLNNPDLLQQRLLDWLTGIVEAHQTQVIETRLYQLLITQLTQQLTEGQLLLLMPFLEQAKAALLSHVASSQPTIVVEDDDMLLGASSDVLVVAEAESLDEISDIPAEADLDFFSDAVVAAAEDALPEMTPMQEQDFLFGEFALCDALVED